MSNNFYLALLDNKIIKRELLTQYNSKIFVAVRLRMDNTSLQKLMTISR